MWNVTSVFMKTLGCAHVVYCILAVVCDVTMNVFSMLLCVYASLFLTQIFLIRMLSSMPQVWIIKFLCTDKHTYICMDVNTHLHAYI